MAAHVIKRGAARGNEAYSSDKLHASIMAACLSVRSPEGEAEMIAHHVSSAVTQWCHRRAAVTSHDLRRVAGGLLHEFHPEAGYLYQNHRLVV